MTGRHMKTFMGFRLRLLHDVSSGISCPHCKREMGYVGVVNIYGATRWRCEHCGSEVTRVQPPEAGG